MILRADVERVGKKGDVLDVADGYGRNYLVPKGLAMKASKGAVTQAATMRRARDAKDARDREAAEELAQRVAATPVRISARAGVEWCHVLDGRRGGTARARAAARRHEAC